MSKNPKKFVQILREAGFTEEQIKAQKSLDAPIEYVSDIALPEAERLANFEAICKFERAKDGGLSQVRLESFASLLTKVHEIRTGKDSNTGKERPRDLSLAEATKAIYGVSLQEYLREMFGIDKNDTLSSIARKTGRNDIEWTDVQKLLQNYGKDSATFANINFSNINGTNQLQPYHFIIPEVILSAIDLGYKGGARYRNWIATTENITANKATLPYIEQGDLMPHRIKEGGAIPLGTMKFGQKEVRAYKVGIGVKLTQEIIEQSSINMLSLFLSMTGLRMGWGMDVAAIDCLVNGDQSDLSESAPVIGVKDVPSGLQHYDIDRVYAKMRMLNQTPTLAIAKSDDLIEDLNLANPERPRETVEMYAGMKGMATDMFLLADDQYLFVDTTKCMVELVYGGMRVGQDTSASNDTTEVYVSKYIGFAIAKRDARVVVDKSLAYAANPIPDYMDVESFLASGFKS